MVSLPNEPAAQGRDLGEESAPVLLELVGSIAFPAGRILVPHCGDGHDVLSLAGPSNVVTGLEARSGSPDRFEVLRRAAGIPRSFVRFVVADLFSWSADAAFEVIWQTSYATIEPGRRAAWAQRVHELLVPGGVLAMLIYPVGSPVDSPVDSIDLAELAGLLAAGFHRDELRPVARSHPARQGLEWLGRWRKR
jgi:methyl halide transferase